MCPSIKHVRILVGDRPERADSALIHVYQPLLVVQDTEQGTKAPPGWGRPLGNIAQCFSQGGFSMGRRLAGPLVDHWIPLLEKMAIVLACLSS